MALADADRIAEGSDVHAWPVLSSEGICGVVSSAQLRRFLAEGKGAAPIGLLLDGAMFPHVHRDHSFDVALERMGASGLVLLPVVSRFNVREILGVVHLSDILAAYRLSPPLGKSSEPEEP